MADIKDLADGRSAMLWFDPRRVQIKAGLNARDLESPESRLQIDSIKVSIRENGYLSSRPLEVFRSASDEIFVTAGHRRLVACKELVEEGFDLPKIPCVPEPRGTSDRDRILRQNIENESQPLSALEQGYNVKRAMALGYTLSEIAKRLGKSETHVGHLLDLQAAPEEVHEMIRKGEVSATMAGQTIRRQGEQRGAQALKTAVAEARAKGKKKATAKDVERIVPPVDQTALDTDFGIKDLNDMQTLIRVGTSKIILSPEGAERLAHLILDHFAAKEGHQTVVAPGEELEAAGCQ